MGSGTEGRWIRRARTGYCNQEGPTGQAVQGMFYSMDMADDRTENCKSCDWSHTPMLSTSRPSSTQTATRQVYHEILPWGLTMQKDEVYLNLVLEFVPETVYRASRHYSKLKQVMPMLQVKLYMYQVSAPLSVN